MQDTFMREMLDAAQELISILLNSRTEFNLAGDTRSHSCITLYFGVQGLVIVEKGQFISKLAEEAKSYFLVNNLRPPY